MSVVTPDRVASGPTTQGVTADGYKFGWQRAFAAYLPAGRKGITQRTILHGLALFMDADGSNCYPSYEDLARVTGASQETLAQHLPDLETAGWFVRRELKLRGQQWARLLYDPQIPHAVMMKISRAEEARSGQQVLPLPGGRLEVEEPERLPRRHSANLSAFEKALSQPECLAPEGTQVGPGQPESTNQTKHPPTHGHAHVRGLAGLWKTAATALGLRREAPPMTDDERRRAEAIAAMWQALDAHPVLMLIGGETQRTTYRYAQRSLIEGAVPHDWYSRKLNGPAPWEERAQIFAAALDELAERLSHPARRPNERPDRLRDIVFFFAIPRHFDRFEQTLAAGRPAASGAAPDASGGALFGRLRLSGELQRWAETLHPLMTSAAEEVQKQLAASREGIRTRWAREPKWPHWSAEFRAEVVEIRVLNIFAKMAGHPEAPAALPPAD